MLPSDKKKQAKLYNSNGKISQEQRELKVLFTFVLLVSNEMYLYAKRKVKDKTL